MSVYEASTMWTNLPMLLTKSSMEQNQSCRSRYSHPPAYPSSLTLEDILSGQGVGRIDCSLVTTTQLAVSDFSRLELTYREYNSSHDYYYYSYCCSARPVYTIMQCPGRGS